MVRCTAEQLPKARSKGAKEVAMSRSQVEGNNTPPAAAAVYLKHTREQKIVSNKATMVAGARLKAIAQARGEGGPCEMSCDEGGVRSNVGSGVGEEKQSRNDCFVCGFGDCDLIQCDTKVCKKSRHAECAQADINASPIPRICPSCPTLQDDRSSGGDLFLGKTSPASGATTNRKSTHVLKLGRHTEERAREISELRQTLNDDAKNAQLLGKQSQEDKNPAKASNESERVCKKQMQEWSRKYTSLEGKYKKLQGQALICLHLEGKYKKLQEQVERKDTERESLDMQYDELLADNSVLQITCQDLGTTVDALTDANASLETSMQTMEERLRMFAKEREESECGYKKELDEAKAAYDRLAANHTALVGRCKKLESDTDLKNEEVESLKEQASATKKIMEAERAKSDREHVEKLHASKMARDKSIAEYAALEEKFRSLQSKAKLTNKEFELLKEQVNTAEKRIDALTVANTSLEKSGRTMKEEILTLKAEKKDSECKLKAQLGVSEAMHNQILKSLQKKAKLKNEEVELLKDQANSLTVAKALLEKSGRTKEEQMHALKAEREEVERKFRAQLAASSEANKEMKAKYAALVSEFKTLQSMAEIKNVEFQLYHFITPKGSASVSKHALEDVDPRQTDLPEAKLAYDEPAVKHKSSIKQEMKNKVFRKAKTSSIQDENVPHCQGSKEQQAKKTSATSLEIESKEAVRPNEKDQPPKKVAGLLSCQLLPITNADKHLIAKEAERKQHLLETLDRIRADVSKTKVPKVIYIPNATESARPNEKQYRVEKSKEVYTNKRVKSSHAHSEAKNQEVTNRRGSSQPNSREELPGQKGKCSKPQRTSGKQDRDDDATEERKIKRAKCSDSADSSKSKRTSSGRAKNAIQRKGPGRLLSSGTHNKESNKLFEKTSNSHRSIKSYANRPRTGAARPKLLDIFSSDIYNSKKKPSKSRKTSSANPSTQSSQISSRGGVGTRHKSSRPVGGKTKVEILVTKAYEEDMSFMEEF